MPIQLSHAWCQKAPLPVKGLRGAQLKVCEQAYCVTVLLYVTCKVIILEPFVLTNQNIQRSDIIQHKDIDTLHNNFINCDRPRQNQPYCAEPQSEIRVKIVAQGEY